MTDQPKTMLEYHFRKLARTVVQSVGLVVASMFLATAVFVSPTNPAAGQLMFGGSVFMLAIVRAIMSDGYLRTAFNTLLGGPLSELNRPNEPQTGGLADD